MTHVVGRAVKLVKLQGGKLGLSLPIRTLPSRQLHTPYHNLPRPLTTLIGREQELRDALATLLRPEVRLLTLTGPPGIGKSRLALEVAFGLVDRFEGGVYFVPLASITDPLLVVPAIAQALSVKEAGGLPLLQSVSRYLGDRHILLFVDNFEQVVDAAGFLGELLSECANLKALATSRTLLRIYGDHDFPLSPMSLPDTRNIPTVKRLAEYDAIRLFVERARAVRPDFSLSDETASDIAQICARLDGLPLAIELAAARMRHLNLKTLLARMGSRLDLLTGGTRNIAPRQQTLHNAIEWSYSLLDRGEQLLFNRLSVFVGGCTLEAIEAVCNTGTPLPLDPLDGVSSLIDKSLLRQEDMQSESRYWLLETIREYGREELATGGEEKEIRRQHAHYYMTFAERARPELLKAAQVQWSNRIETEHDNLRAALEWSKVTSGAVDVGLRIAVALALFWRLKGHLSEARERLSSVLAEANNAGYGKDESRKGVLAKANEEVGWIAFVQGDYAAARSYCESALAMQRELGDKKNIATSLNRLGAVAGHQGDYETARGLLEEGLALSREVEDKYGISTSLNILGELARLQGEYGKARPLYRESLEIKREMGGKMGIAVGLHNLAHVAYNEGDYKEAEALFMESLMLFQEFGSRLDLAMCVAGLAGVAGATRQPERATRLLGAAGAQFEDLGITVWPADRADYDIALTRAKAELSKEAFNAAWASGQSMSIEEAVSTTLDLSKRLLQATTTEELAGNRNTPANQQDNLSANNTAGLTHRELEVLRLVAQGLSNTQVAQKLTISPNTVSIHLYSVYNKLGVKSRTAATRYATEHRLF